MIELLNAIALIDKNKPELDEILEQLEKVPAPVNPSPGPWHLLSSASHSVGQALRQFEVDRRFMLPHDETSYGRDLTSMRFWQVTFRLQLLTNMLPSISSLYDEQSRIWGERPSVFHGDPLPAQVHKIHVMLQTNCRRIAVINSRFEDAIDEGACIRF